MISAPALLQDCQRLVRRLEDDLRERLADHSDLEAPLRAEYQRARDGKRTGQTWSAWRDDYLTQVSVHWVLAAVFLRFLEDNQLIPEPWISGPGPRRTQAQDRQERFFAAQPAASDRDYLLAAFRDVEGLPAMAPLFDERHNPLFRLGPTADGARLLLDLFRRLHQESGDLVHDFTDPAWSTRFLGDLYQDLSEAARKRYALLQTPEFVEEFILDRTLEPAMAEVGYRNVTLIDPACGSGHFLLGAFHRLFDRWQRDEPGTEERALAARALDQIAGVDLNPFAIAIARFRLVIAALKVSNLKRLADAPAFPLNLAAGDSLLHGPRPGDLRGRSRYLFGEDPLAHVYETEDADELRRLLGQQYTVVVGNPPYITPKDPVLNEAYRDRFGSCHGKYSLAVPFTERLFDLTALAESTNPSGWTGIITSNSFMKREFGKKLIQQYVPRWDITHVIDTSGVYIPGHGTPTVILIGRRQPPIQSTVRTAMGIRGEPSTPEEPAKGLVWSAITQQIDFPGSQSPFLSVVDLPREQIHQHPWSLGGGGAAELKILIEEAVKNRLQDKSQCIGIASVTGEDDLYIFPDKAGAARLGIQDTIPLVIGEDLRDWSAAEPQVAIWLYSDDFRLLQLEDSPMIFQLFWRFKNLLSRRKRFGTPMLERGLTWFEWQELYVEKLRTPLSLTFAFVATHNHFVLDQGGKVFKQSAPVIKLPANATIEEHLALLGLLNSSTACFWMKQVSYPKATTFGDISTEKGRPEANRYEFAGTQLLEFPVPDFSTLESVTQIAREIDALAQEITSLAPRNIIASWKQQASPIQLDHLVLQGEIKTAAHRRRMIFLQEELDWEIYRCFGLIQHSETLDRNNVNLGIDPEDRPAFWNSNSPPPTLDSALANCFSRRRILIQEDPSLAILENPMYKRPWLGQQGVFGHSTSTYQERADQALRGWLLDRLEDRRYWPEPHVTSTSKLADRLREDDEFRQVAALYRGRDDFDWTALVTDLALEEAVPFLAAHRYTESGQRKRDDWEETWRLQREEDEIDARTKLPAGDPQRLSEDEARTLKAREVGDIPVPPKYASGDFRKAPYWRLRGKLDVPKERFIHYPGLERGADTSPVIGWAGWNHLEQAQALGTALTELRENEGWDAERLKPVLAGLLELLPWLLQWHNDPDPAHGGERLGNYFKGFLDEEARSLGVTRQELAGWRPTEKTRRGRGRKAGG